MFPLVVVPQVVDLAEAGARGPPLCHVAPGALALVPALTLVKKTRRSSLGRRWRSWEAQSEALD